MFSTRHAFVVSVFAFLLYPTHSSAQQAIGGTVFDARNGDPVAKISVQVLVSNARGQLAQPTPRLVGQSNDDGEFRIATRSGISGPIAVAFYDTEARTNGSYAVRLIPSLSGTSNLVINPALYKYVDSHVSSLTNVVTDLAGMAPALLKDREFHLSGYVVELVDRQRNEDPGRVRFGSELNDILALVRPQRADIAFNGTQGWEVFGNSIRGFTRPVEDRELVVACNLDAKVREAPGLGASSWLGANSSGPVLVAGPRHFGEFDSEIVHYDPELNIRQTNTYPDVMLSAASPSGSSRYSAVGTAEGSVLVVRTGSQERQGDRIKLFVDLGVCRGF